MTKNKGGRPSTYITGSIEEASYSKSHAEKLLELLSQGFTNSECIAALDLKKDTFYRWIREHEDFKSAYEKGRPKAEAFWSNELRKMTMERNDKGAKACIMILNNNFGWGRDEFKSQVTNNTQINVQGNMQVLDSKSAPELLESILKDLKFADQKHILPIEVIDAEYRPIEIAARAEDQSGTSEIS